MHIPDFKKLRESKGLSQSQACDILGIKQPALSRLETNGVPSTVLRYAEMVEKLESLPDVGSVAQAIVENDAVIEDVSDAKEKSQEDGVIDPDGLRDTLAKLKAMRGL